MDWNSPPALEGEFQSSIAYDALNRVKFMQYPKDVDGNRKALMPTYNRAGVLESVKLDGDTYVERIAYNAKGQRTLIAYGNNVMTRYAYDVQTFHLTRMRTDRYTNPNANTLIYAQDTSVSLEQRLLQDLEYEYDLAGNIVKLHDRTPKCGIQGTGALDREFSYDPLYRLLTANGREGDVPPPIPPNSPWDDKPRSTDLTLARKYTESYEYDSVGNMTNLSHTHYLSAGMPQGARGSLNLSPIRTG